MRKPENVGILKATLTFEGSTDGDLGDGPDEWLVSA